MTCINLLPWRETQRKEQQRQFYSITGGAALLMALVIFYVHIHIGGLIEGQNSRNRYLEDEIAQVEKIIVEIKNIKSEKTQLLARMNIIQQLQSRRPEIVHVFDSLVRTVPSGIYLTQVKQEGATISIEGVAQSNARVSSFMRNLDASEWFENPRLDVIKANDKDKVRSSQFKLLVNQSSARKFKSDGDAKL